jgi:TRAP-type C4-dicarboxylate transport system substrate-binding protein
MRSLRIAAGLAATLLPLPVVAQEPITIRFAMTAPATGFSWARWFEPENARIEKDSEGTLKIQTYFGGTLANMTNAWDRTVNGVADMSYAVTGPLRGKLVKTNVVELPNDANGKEASGAMWMLFESGVIADEWVEVKPLFLLVYPQSIFHMRQPVTKLEDMKGLKIGANSKVAAESVERLGAAPVTTTPSEMYENLQRGVVSGTVVGWNGVLGFKLQEVANYHLNFQNGSGGGFTVMNKQVYDKLPAKARAALDKRSGYGVSKEFGVLLDKVAQEQYDAVKAMPGHTQGYLAPDEAARWRRAVQPITDEWVKATPNGAKVLEAYRAAVLKIRAGG